MGLYSGCRLPMGSKTSKIASQATESSANKNTATQSPSSPGPNKSKLSWISRKSSSLRKSKSSRNSKAEVINNEKENEPFFATPKPANTKTMSRNESYDLIFSEGKKSKPELLTPSKSQTPLKDDSWIEKELSEADQRRKKHLEEIRLKASQETWKLNRALKTKEEMCKKFQQEKQQSLKTKLEKSQQLRNRVLSEITEKAQSFNNSNDLSLAPNCPNPVPKVCNQSNVPRHLGRSLSRPVRKSSPNTGNTSVKFAIRQPNSKLKAKKIDSDKYVCV